MLNRSSQDISLNVMRVMSSIRSSFDLANSSPRHDAWPASDIRDAYLKFEAVRITFRQNSRNINFRNVDNTYSRILTLRSDLSSLQNDISFMSVAAKIVYRPMPPHNEGGWNIHPALDRAGLTISEAVIILNESISVIKDLPNTSGQADLFETVRQLENVVPSSQSVAPLQFQVTGGRLSLKRQKSGALPEDSLNIEEAKKQLEHDGDRILSYLSQSNCDRRIIDSVQNLQIQLKSGNNIVRLGLTGIGCDILYDKMAQEIPDAVSALLKAHTVGLNMYVAQFPEWQRFSGQASQVNLTDLDIDILKSASEYIIYNLKSSPEAADPEVVDALSSIRKITEVVGGNTKKAAFALWKSIENLAIIIFQYGNTIVRKTAENVANDLASAASKVIVGTLMTTALAGIAYLTPISASLPGGAWLTKAAEIVQKQIEQLAK